MSEELDQEIKKELALEEGIEKTWTDEQAQEAEEMGWIGPEKSGHLPEGKKYVGPVEFMERNPLYKKVKQLESSFGQLNAHYHNVSENERKKARKDYEEKIETLKSEKVKALDDSDNRRVVDIDEEIRNTDKPAEVSKEFDLAFSNWKEKNAWFDSEPELKGYADYIGPRYADEHPGLPYDEILDHVTKVVKKTFPDKFTNLNRSRPASVEGDTPSLKQSAGKAMTDRDLDPNELEMFKNFKRMGVFKKTNQKGEDIEEFMIQTYLNQVKECRPTGGT